LTDDKQTTKDRLLDTAEKLFGEKCFDDVSVRELAAAAGVNVAAINYHFQGKDNLIQQVVRRRFSLQRDKTLGALDDLLRVSGGQPALADVIHTLVAQYLDATILSHTSKSHLTMLMRDMHHKPDAIHQQFFREMVAPIFMAFSKALMMARPNLTQEDLNWIIASIVSQIHHFTMRWHKKTLMAPDSETLAVMVKVFPALGLTAEQYVQQTTDHITRFSTGAVNAMYPEAS